MTEDIETIDLKKAIDLIIKNNKDIKEIYLFGSRVYKTNSIRSDIDLLLVVENGGLAYRTLNETVGYEYRSLDLFITYDSKNATSASNGSIVSYKPNSKRKYKDLFDQLDAVLLWNHVSKYNNGFTDWEQKVERYGTYSKSILPGKPNLDNSIKTLLGELESKGIKTFFAGDNIYEISKKIIELIEISLSMPARYSKQAKNFNFDNFRIESEYDFQNLIHMILRPVFPDIKSEPPEIFICGSNKYADFSTSKNKIVIEAKWIDDNKKKNEVIKTLEGLKSFYLSNVFVESLIFLVLYNPKKTTLDHYELEKLYSNNPSNRPVFVKFLTSDYVGKGE